MGVQKLRDELHEYINHADEKFLKMVYAMSKKHDQQDVVGFDTNGIPISKNELVKRVKTASKRVKSGDFISQEEIEREIENW